MLLIILMFFNIGIADAQNHSFYSNINVNVGTQFGYDIGLSYVYKSNYSIAIGYGGVQRNAASLPEDYSIGFANG